MLIVDGSKRRSEADRCPVTGVGRDFDPFVDPYLADPYPFWLRARRSEPVFYSPELDYWVVTRYEDINAHERYLTRNGVVIRKFFLKYQDRILFGSDGDPRRGAEEFWVPHFRFLETYDEHFDHPAQLR